ncbi:MAG: ferrous iron transport protein A [Candidatus Cloacimonetes bacterium]|nr:ferrous iron transport protein A [Candidatus Cloacimonadota bacterium]
MFGRGKGLGRRKGNRMHGGRHGRHRRVPVNLNGAIPGNKYIVKFNPDKKTIEMGIYAGSIISVQKNEFDDPNIIVAVGESRYIIPRKTAEQILIK